MKIAIAIPAYGGVIRCETMTSIVQDCAWVNANGHELLFYWMDLHGVARARNMAVQRARESEADLLLMLDADTACDPTASGLELLVATMREKGCEAVAAVVPTRPPRMAPNVDPVKPFQAYEATKAGAAYLLLDIHKLEKLEPGHAWFNFTMADDGITIKESEDLYFCSQVRNRGGKVYADFRIPTTHMATVPLELKRLLGATDAHQP